MRCRAELRDLPQVYARLYTVAEKLIHDKVRAPQNSVPVSSFIA
jgi:hypothetical protein